LAAGAVDVLHLEVRVHGRHDYVKKSVWAS
jgi:hypothetical protein